ncbi:MAG TPA: sulfotransferase [Gammaproteobacteria bacterium]|jgi:hypothetical protein|nr:sulfotransferase [Gammaproteobacteria bacterium]
MKKKVYVVLGMPRSGTSAITRALPAMGVNLGDALLPADVRNAKGFFEDAEVLYKINRVVSAAVHQRWMPLNLDPQLIDKDAALKRCKHYAVGVLSERLASVPAWGFKDPRTLSVFPFWRSVLNTLGVDESYIIVVRNPLAAAHSVARFAHTDVKSGLLLWLRFMFTALEATEGKNRVVVSYENMVNQPRHELVRLQRALNREGVMSEADLSAYCDQFIDKKLRHHEYTYDDLKDDPDVGMMPEIKEWYDFLLMLANNQLSFDSPEYREHFNEVKAQWQAMRPTADYIALLHEQQKNLERDFRAVKKSWFFKLISPLVKGELALRRFRRRLRSRERELMHAS